jgi:hypothetical protein
MLNRLEFGKMLIDAVTFKMSQLPPDYEIPELKNAIYKTESKDMIALAEETDQIKLKALVDVLLKPAEKSADSVDVKLVESCVQVSKDPERELDSLIKRCMDIGKSMSQNIFESLLNLFIFTHRPAVFIESIKKVLKKYDTELPYCLSIDFDRRVTIEE